jgi:aminopeptidase
MEDPLIMTGLDSKALNTVRTTRRRCHKYFYDVGINKSKVQWCVVAGATTGWAQKIFPKLPPKKAHNRLWREIFKIARLDAPDALKCWKEHDRQMHARMRKLNRHRVQKLHFTSEGTNLTITLSKKALFLGGSLTSSSGVRFEPNIPSEEVFSAPDWRGTNGYVTVTKPVLVNGNLIEGLWLQFQDGIVTQFRCIRGAKVFGDYIDSDKGARRLGEVALVGIDSPVYQSKVVFEEILFDENAACHIALGSAYAFCVQDAGSMKKKELNAIGFNDSSVHLDLMISDNRTNVVATTFGGRTISLIRKGVWQKF